MVKKTPYDEVNRLGAALVMLSEAGVVASSIRISDGEIEVDIAAAIPHEVTLDSLKVGQAQPTFFEVTGVDPNGSDMDKAIAARAAEFVAALRESVDHVEPDDG